MQPLHELLCCESRAYGRIEMYSMLNPEHTARDIAVRVDYYDTVDEATKWSSFMTH